tara:strand:+ start:51 stop:695 length:645 start_codon:yes stop_codon:yes gene_type:complete
VLLIKDKGSHEFSDLKSLRNLTIRNLNSQAAMEFLMTYGWVILVVLVAIGALAYFGVLSPDMFVPEKCSLPTGIICLDFNVETSRVILVLQNNLGETITINKVDVTKKNDGSCSNIEPIAVNNNQKAIITVLDCNNGNIKDKFTGTLNVTYTKESLLTHVAKGSIVARITEGSATSSSSTCQNAEDNGLCDGLDIVFGVGYKDACCSEFSLCCS